MHYRPKELIINHMRQLGDLGTRYLSIANIYQTTLFIQKNALLVLAWLRFIWAGVFSNILKNR